MFVSNKQDIAQRCQSNPLVTPADVTPSRDDFEVVGAFNPAVFEYRHRIGLLLRIAERPRQRRGHLTVPFLDPAGNMRLRHFRVTDPDLDAGDPRVVVYRGVRYLTSISHFRTAFSEDGLNFNVAPRPTIVPNGPYETFGIEDARVTRVGRNYVITYSAVSEHEVAAGMITTTNWRTFTRCGPILQPFNKDVCLFKTAPRRWWLIHRPSGVLWNRHWMWISQSPDGRHWGRPRCLAQTRPGKFDSVRIGAGAPPLATTKGPLAIYHGADRNHRYCLGAMLLHPRDPGHVVARSPSPMVKPIAPYERRGFFGNVVFTDGAIRRDHAIWMYYAASDTVTCLARLRLPDIWDHLGRR